MIEHQVNAGQQVFAISWRNPDERHADWGLETYFGAVLEALEAVERITKAEQTQLLGLCAGGIVTSAVVAHLAARGEQERIAGLTLGVCVLDNDRAGTASAFVDRQVAALAVADSARRGTSTGARWPVSSRGCDPTTSCGTTGSTTPCWARTRRRSTSSSGTPTPRTCRPPCTATSSSSRWRTRWSRLAS